MAFICWRNSHREHPWGERVASNGGKSSVAEIGDRSWRGAGSSKVAGVQLLHGIPAAGDTGGRIRIVLSGVKWRY